MCGTGRAFGFYLDNLSFPCVLSSSRPVLFSFDTNAKGDLSDSTSLVLVLYLILDSRNLCLKYPLSLAEIVKCPLDSAFQINKT